MMQESMETRMTGTKSDEELIPAGAVSFGVLYRHQPNGDQGVCIHVFGNDLPGHDKELLRFDCFQKEPHYHYRNAAIKKNERIFLDCTAEGLPLTWTLDKIKNRLPLMLLRCGAEDVARKVDQREVDAAMPKIIAWAENLTATHRK